MIGEQLWAITVMNWWGGRGLDYRRDWISGFNAYELSRQTETGGVFPQDFAIQRYESCKHSRIFLVQLSPGIQYTTKVWWAGGD
jgi:hypothetical protein